MPKLRERLDAAEDAADKIAEAAIEIAETAEAFEEAVERLTPQVEAALGNVSRVTVDIQTACTEATLAVNRFRRCTGGRLVIHWGNIFYPARWGKPFTTVELIFEEVT